METVHDRMPVILKPEEEDLWIDPVSNDDQLLECLKPKPWADMEVYTVSKLVNSPKNDFEEIIEPFHAP